MSTLKNIIITTVFGICLFSNDTKGNDIYPSDITPMVEEDLNDSNEIYSHLHDWECKFIIHDAYHGTVKYHFVNEYIINVDDSISFIGSDGCVWKIPAPYYWIFKNNKK